MDQMGETVKLTAADGCEFNAYVAAPAGSAGEGEPKAGVVVVQEIFGVNSHIRSVADGYAQQGYLAVAPSLFDRVEPGVELAYDADGRDKGVQLALKDLSMDDVIVDIAAAAEEASKAGPVGIVGYCWGGSISYVASARLADQISAASGYYGGQIMPHIDEQPQAPLMLHFGSEDAGIPLDDVDAIAQRHPDVQVFVYEGADHGFNCDVRESFHPDSSELARQRTLEHFAKYLV